MISVLIVEDELIIANDLQDILESNNYHVIGIAKSYDLAINKLSTKQPDIVLLDIQIDGSKDGIDLANTIRNEYEIPFVFISSHTDRATLDRAKKSKPNGFLVKPFEDEDVFVAVEMALSNFSKEQNNNQDNQDFTINESLFIRQKNTAVKVAYDDILYASSDANYCTLYTDDKKFVMRSTLKELESKLNDKRFFRCHKSHLVNLKHLTAINSEVISIQNVELPVGREQQALLMDSINKI
ncbi:MAG: LytTR family transcriptional regulator DNA-binding domain-containing protein [Reichenbachiella sp.]|uniref:LytR/AlgR family response regulator transcription factor n=1 Tax=Reichenbachiella sp. TaxID=2184521 RepID=UPI00296680FC|nr:LytTR family transcriptional regulator DNA-binding domain-containing protein [Reichenbachiella sp.]MDW3209348.1 LytTR family transcriptional regulator DNA-binding domain-containing protein [Reichenbachiella sp.]